ncbi:hypothetical protein I3760_08G062700 [Carya illinoinensis]|nr:hypothetical protein I3760_08G062700 [Carya illinoinensis]KAG2692655.1 hypothetical protein I3760_08G062700 [Carya illinoinensis]KAG2692656.1 hypothetical protein I3760_08G062700 [Carya illinoinensis]KAG2692659.1 hypothetical protein I3760_08G062700 [Carya illinoinensis]KAG2692660.1 hypothetical protein I3760_08G062700 [Carya illinoinensis]
METQIIPCNSCTPAPIPSKLGNQSNFSPKPTLSFAEKPHPKVADSYLNYLRKNGRLSEAVTALDSVAQRGSKVKPKTYLNLLQSCIDANCIQLGRKLHARIDLVEEVNPFVETKIVSMYAKCGCLDDARKVFYEIRVKNLYTWSAMIGACSREQRWREVVELFFDMMEGGFVPDSFLFPKILQACANCRDFGTGKLIHSLVVRCGMSRCLRVNNSILAVYAKSGKLSSARRFFENMDERDRVTWNAIISGYCQKGDNEEARRLLDAMCEEGVQPGSVTWNILISSYNQLGHCDVAMELMRKMDSFGITPDVFTWTSMISGFAQNNRRSQALDLLKDMLWEGVEPNGVTLTSAISACASLKSLDKGMEIHSIAVKMGFICDVLVGNSLVDMYSKCGDLEAAQQVFDMILEKDAYTWNSMIGGYCHTGYCGKAHLLFMKMKESGVPPNVITWNVMISGFMQNGDEDQAMDLFHMMEKDGKIRRNTASWNSLISGYLHIGEKNKAFGIFRQMQSSFVIPNSVTILSVLPACANLVAWKKVKEIHGCVIRRNLETELSIANSLIDTYAKSGNIAYSRTIFDGISSKDVITWNSLIGGYVLHGYADNALDLFNQMKKLRFRPNRGTFVNVIFAYSLAGMVDEGEKAFSSITEEFRIIPALEHYSAMVCLYGRAGRLSKAMEFIDDMPIEPDSSTWAALLTGCRIHGNIGLAIRAGESLLDLEPGNFLIHELILKVYALCGKFGDASKTRKLEKENASQKFLGQCWIEVRNIVHTFLAGDQSSDVLYSWIQRIQEKVKGHDIQHGLCIGEEEREEIGGVHSEKLAFAFAMVGSNAPKVIRIVKNLRMCDDCHRAAKYISVAYGSEIYLNDSQCFHYFKNGHCSCKDYW